MLLTMAESLSDQVPLKARGASSSSQVVPEAAQPVTQGAALAQAFLNACDSAAQPSVEPDTTMRELKCPNPVQPGMVSPATQRVCNVCAGSPQEDGSTEAWYWIILHLKFAADLAAAAHREPMSAQSLDTAIDRSLDLVHQLRVSIPGARG